MALFFRDCLDLVQANEASIQEELDLITSLSMLADYNVSILPLQGTITSKSRKIPIERFMFLDETVWLVHRSSI